ncbi:hypothetical protein [Mesorhizobium sp. WSM2239]|uniref:Uncharacterized protein n=2 Tax=unclassified Mesorhizobium TaxID=325217 RepID=A0AAU8DHA8_9HYPH
MASFAEQAKKFYDDLGEFSATRSNELGQMLQPYVQVTDRYGILVCRITLILGRTPSRSKTDTAIRDLMADVFDFLYEARFLIIKGKPEVAYPLARRAYESLSLMVACFLDKKTAHRWVAGKKLGNAEIRRVLGKHPAGEPEDRMKELYGFFSQVSHPNRDMVAHRFLGIGNEFVLGSIGRPSLTLLADYALKTLELWHWFGAFIGFAYLPVVANADPDIVDEHVEVREIAQQVARWLGEQHNRVLAQEQAEMATAKAARP